jgi:hypothetical protein
MLKNLIFDSSQSSDHYRILEGRLRHSIGLHSVSVGRHQRGALVARVLPAMWLVYRRSRETGSSGWRGHEWAKNGNIPAKTQVRYSVTFVHRSRRTVCHIFVSFDLSYLRARDNGQGCQEFGSGPSIRPKNS